MSKFPPTPEQVAIIEHYSRSPNNLIVDAKAGAAKTTTMEMAAHAGPVEPSLAIAFNVEIKKELAKRFPPHFEVLTINGLGHRAFAKTIGKRLEIDGNKCANLIRGGLRTRGIEDESREIYTAIRKLVGAAKLNGLVLKNAPGVPKRFLHDTEETWIALAQAYDIELTSDILEITKAVLNDSVQMAFNGFLDFDDQIYMSCCFNGSFPGFKRVVVDEAQDMSTMNHFMLRKVARGKVCAVGDPNQSIYAFRGADYTSMEKLREMFKMDTLTLSTSFRCAKRIIEHAQQLVPAIRAWERSPDGEVTRLRSFDAQTFGGDSAVLCRNNAPLIILAFKLLRKRKPVRFTNRDVGRGLVKLALTIADNNPDCDRQDFMLLVNAWMQKEIQKALDTNNEQKAELISDKGLAILGIAEQTANVRECTNVLEEIFSNESATVIFSTGHGAKGKEWDDVYHLDSWLLPSRFAVTDAQVQQEKNLDYVIRTRARKRLFYINSQEFNEL